MFYYYGGKRALANRYDAPVYDTIVEPFAGSAAYSMYHLPGISRVILVEKDGRVAELWRRLLAMSPEEVLALPIPAVGDITDDLLYMTSATSNAIARCQRMTVTDRMPKLIGQMLDNIASLVRHARGKVQLIVGDYSEAPDIEATWFIDPPYVVTERGSTPNRQGMGYGRGCDSSSIDYRQLGEWCASRKGQVIVCEQHGAGWLPFRPLAVTTDSLGQFSREVVWTNEGYGQQWLAV